MWSPEEVIARLSERGELWQAVPGIVGIRGDTLALQHRLTEYLEEIGHLETREEWQVPQAMPLEVLARAEYFASFPQWLTLASHLDNDESILQQVASAEDPANAASHASAPAGAALPPAVCYHAYAALTGETIASARYLSAQGTCWRHEGSRHVPLERGWAFTMREIICLGTAGETTAFRTRLQSRVTEFAVSLGLEPIMSEASDPFFAPTARGKALLQRVKGLKHELLLPLGNGRHTAAASFNLHEAFFGEAFDIRLPGGNAASTACVAFGLERWLLAYLCAHGPDLSGWKVMS